MSIQDVMSNTQDSDSLSLPLRTNSPDQTNAAPQSQSAQPDNPTATLEGAAPSQTQPSLANTTSTLSGSSQQTAANASQAVDSSPQPKSMFGRILAGALKAMTGVGEGMVTGGIPGAVEGGINPKIAATKFQQQQQLAADHVSFENGQAAQSAAQAVHDHLLNDALSDQMKENASNRSMDFLDKLQQRGVPAPAIVEDSAAGIQAYTDQLSKQNGGAIPNLFAVHIPSPSGQPGFVALVNVSSQANSKTPPAYLNDYADKSGQDGKLLSEKWANGNTDTRQALSTQALSFLHPSLDSSNPVGQLMSLQAIKRQYQISHGKDADTSFFDDNIKFLNGQYSDMKSAIAAQAKTQAQQAGQAEYQKSYNQQKGAQDALNAGTIPGQPNARQNLIDDIGQGRVQLTPGMLRSKDGQALLQQVVGKYSDYDPTMADAYKKTREDFTSGKTAVGINSYNTAIAHLGTMFDHISNASSVEINNPWSDVHRQLDLDKQLVSTELAKAVSNGNMTEGEKKDILNSVSGVTQSSYLTRIREAVTLLNGKLESYQQQWNNGMPKGAVSPVPIISPQSDATLAKISGNPTPTQPQRNNSAPQGRAVRDGKGNILGYTIDGKTMTPAGGR